MATITPTFNASVTGKGILTSLDKTITWVNGEKLEQDYAINSTDGVVAINYSYVNNISLMVFTSISSFKVTITIGTNVIAHEVNNVFIFDPTSTFLGTVDKIEISTAQTTNITVSVRVYGA